MRLHYKFLPGHQRRFLLQIAEVGGISQSQIAANLGVSYNTYREWLREKYCIPVGVADYLFEKYNVPFLENRGLLLQRWKTSKSNASAIGGAACFKKHGSLGTTEGRSRGGSISLRSMRARGVIPEAKNFKTPKFSKKLAELVGVLLGDGGITDSQITITLNLKKDKEYSRYITHLLLDLFGYMPGIYVREKENTIVLCLSGISLVKYLVKIGLHMGNKVKQQVGVPEWIAKNMEFKSACVRGLMDTDGCVTTVIHKRKSGKYFYKYFCFANKSVPILGFMKDALEGLGMAPSVAGFRVWLYNKADFLRYLEAVGTNNSRLTKQMETCERG